MSNRWASRRSAHRHASGPIRLVKGLLRYGPVFAAQAAAFFFVLVIGETVATGAVGNRHRLAIGLFLVIAALGVAEAHFKLYKRVWAVAGLADSVALAVAVVEAAA